MRFEELNEGEFFTSLCEICDNNDKDLGKTFYKIYPIFMVVDSELNVVEVNAVSISYGTPCFFSPDTDVVSINSYFGEVIKDN